MLITCFFVDYAQFCRDSKEKGCRMPCEVLQQPLRAQKWWTIFLFSRKILSTSNWRIFRVSKGGANSASRKILREKLELHSTSKKSLNIAKMVEKRFELPTSTHDLSYEKIRLADCHKIPIFSDKSENPHARVTGVHKFLTFTPPSVPVDNREASHQEMKPL